MIYLLRLLFLLLFVVRNTMCLAQSQGPTIKYLGVEDGLSNNVVNSLYMDRFGFMWMGTYDGLNRYDGYDFKIFRNKWGSEHSLIYNHITALNGDGKDRIWIGTQKGISYFDYKDSKFNPIFYKEADQRVKITAAINAIAIGKSGSVYLATEEEGLFVLKEKAFVAERLAHNKVLNFAVKAICEDGANIWMYINGAGLFKYNERTKTMRCVNSEITHVSSIINGDAYTLWIGTEKGLFSYDKKSSQLQRAPFKLSGENITGVSLDKEKKLWVCTDGAGITVYDRQKNEVNYLVAGKGKGFLSSNSIGAVFEDREARKWIATFRGG